jgi:hypothetical protein
MVHCINMTRSLSSSLVSCEENINVLELRLIMIAFYFHGVTLLEEEQSHFLRKKGHTS